MKRCPSCLSAFPTNYTHCPRDGSSLAEASDWSEGTVVRGKYQIIAKVGQGGMAAVYKALHVRFKEPRALKVINPELANDANFVRRFEQEAIITRKLQHPNAVRVDDIDEAEDGRPFIVMEYVEGGNLKDVIEQEAPLPVERVCSIVKQVAAALDAAHRLGLVHRDIKPANIALVGSGLGLGTSSDPVSGDHVKVLDFGIAKLKEAHLEDSKVHPMTLMTLTGTGMVIGTPAYMSPEQAKGLKGEQLDGRADIYSLGVVAYQMLTGDLPLKADSTLELLMAHVSTLPKPIHEVRTDLNIPAAVAAVVMRCLEKKRELRPASGQALVEEIELAAHGGTEVPVQPLVSIARKHVPPTQAPELPALLTVRSESGVWHLRRWLWAMTAVLIVGTLGSAGYLYVRKSPPDQNKLRVAVTPPETQPIVPRTADPLVSIPGKLPPATRPSGPTSDVSHEPVHINKPVHVNKPVHIVEGPLAPQDLLRAPGLNENGLTSAIGDLGVESGLVQLTGDGRERLQQKDDRNYYEFFLLRGAVPQPVATVSLQLKTVDAAHGKFTLNVSADDKTIEKRDRHIGEPIQFYSGRDHLLFELVIWTVDQNKATGYLSTPKDAPAPIQADNSSTDSAPDAAAPLSSNSLPSSVPIPAIRSSSAAPAPQSAQLEIHTMPAGVRIHIDGQLEGLTGSDGHLQARSIAAGQHRLRLDHPGYQRYEETIDLVAGLNTKSITLVPVVPSVYDGVRYFYGILAVVNNGRLTVSNDGLVFNGGTKSFGLACSAIAKVERGGQDQVMGGFRVKSWSKNYSFEIGLGQREAVLKSISDACNLQ